MTSALFDTTFFIDLHRGDAGATDAWAEIRSGTLTGFYSPITVFELWLARGITESEEMFYLGVFRRLRLAPLSAAAARLAGSWIRALQPPLSEAISRDALIAATAQVRSASVYTRNVRDFSRFIATIVQY